MSEEGSGNGQETGGEEARAKRVLSEISSRAWEHPADRAALQALRRIPVFDDVLRSMFGFFGEKPIRLAFQANAVRVSERQFPHLHALYQDVCKTMDPEEEYDLFVSQTPIVNAGAYGMDRPFIILNSGTIWLLNDEELSFILGHELGHIMSDHVLYRTMTVLLIQLASMGFPVVGLAARAVLVALLEWYRKSELSSDRAGLLTVQDPQVAMGAMLKMAGGIPNGGKWEQRVLPGRVHCPGRGIPDGRGRGGPGLQGPEPHGHHPPLLRSAGVGDQGVDRGRRLRSDHSG